MIDPVTLGNSVEELHAEARYQRERLRVYRTKIHSSQPTTVAHLRQRERECEYAEQRLHTAEHALIR